MRPMMFEKKLIYEELTDACDEFFPEYTLVKSRLPKNATTEDILKILEVVRTLAYKNRTVALPTKLTIAKERNK